MSARSVGNGGLVVRVEKAHGGRVSIEASSGSQFGPELYGRRTFTKAEARAIAKCILDETDPQR